MIAVTMFDFVVSMKFPENILWPLLFLKTIPFGEIRNLFDYLRIGFIHFNVSFKLQKEIICTFLSSEAPLI